MEIKGNDIADLDNIGSETCFIEPKIFFGYNSSKNKFQLKDWIELRKRTTYHLKNTALASRFILEAFSELLVQKGRTDPSSDQNRNQNANANVLQPLGSSNFEKSSLATTGQYSRAQKHKRLLKIYRAYNNLDPGFFSQKIFSDRSAIQRASYPTQREIGRNNDLNIRIGYFLLKKNVYHVKLRKIPLIQINVRLFHSFHRFAHL
jgi:hypothetical protein